jgi:glycosyltransferase involved in cell wall biosynthesis
MLTSEWPSTEHPEWVPFIVQEVKQLRENSIDVDVLPFRGGMRPQNYLRAWMKLRTKLRKQRYDLIHAQFGQSGLLALPTKPCPLVVTYRGSDLNGIVNKAGRQTTVGWLLRKVSQLVALYANSIILVSPKLAQFVSRKDYYLIPGGLDMEFFQPIPQDEARGTLGLTVNQRYVLFAGNRNNQIKRYGLAKTAVSLCNIERIELLVAEGVRPERMPLYMNAADALLLTSSNEGSPNVIKEALACNLPVVAVDVGDVRERLQDVDGCIICEDNGPETIAAALHAVLQRGKRVNGRATVQELDIRLTTLRIIEVYQRTLSNQ